MKNILFFLSFNLLCFVNLEAQDMVEVTYEITQHIDPPENMPVDSDFPSKRVTRYNLEFADKKSLYSRDLDFKDPNANQSRRRWRRSPKPHEIYFDFAEQQHLERLDFYRKEFLVKDSIPKNSWKIVASEQRDILGYTAMKAILNDTTEMVEAWFTPQIPISVGPEDYNGLPGLILAVAIDENRVILAKKINSDTEEMEIKTPKKGKKMVRSEFEVLKKEKMAEMKKMRKNNKRRWMITR